MLTLHISGTINIPETGIFSTQEQAHFLKEIVARMLKETFPKGYPFSEGSCVSESSFSIKITDDADGEW